MASATKRARLSDSSPVAATAAAVLFGCTAEDVTSPCGFAALPLPVVLRIFALLPPDERARAASVCQAWRYVLTAGPSSWRLWTELDLSERSGVTCVRGDAALEGAAALARGHLRALKLREFTKNFTSHAFSDAALLRVLAANAGLEELAYVRVGNAWTTIEQLQALLAAAPTLQRLTADVLTMSAATASALLRRQPPFAAVRPVQLRICDSSDASPLRTADGVIALAADVAACESLRGFGLSNSNLEAPAALQALVDAVLTCHNRRLFLTTCTFAPAVALPQLARLLVDGRCRLRNVCIQNSPTLLADAQDADIGALCDALAHSCKLRTLELENVGLPAGAQRFMALLLHRALASRPAGSPAAVVTVE